MRTPAIPKTVDTNSHMSDAGAPGQQIVDAEANALNLAKMRSDLSSETDSEAGPSSPHFYSSSVRQNSPSVDSYSTDAEDFETAKEHNDRAELASSASEQQLEEEAVKLDLLRRTHAQRAKETLEQLQISSAASATGSQAGDTPKRRSGDGISTNLVRERSQQLRQASEDLKRLAVEQRTSAEDAVANYLFQVQLLTLCLSQQKQAHHSQANS